MAKGKAKTKSKHTGRPSGFNERLGQVIINLAKDAKTLDQIAEIIGVSVATIKVWIGTHNLIDEVRAARSIGDDLVEATLFQRACGYSHKAEKVFFDQKTSTPVVHNYVEHYAPDTTAMIFWLKNRRPEQWREKQEIDLTKDIKIIIEKDEQDL